jgi:hypothetical protein
MASGCGSAAATDQESEGQESPSPTAIADRVSATSLSAFSADEIVKHYATRAGLDPAGFAGHSLRSGFPTSAAKRGASVFKMTEVSRHRSVDTLCGYVRRVDLFKQHAGAAFP